MNTKLDEWAKAKEDHHFIIGLPWHPGLAGIKTPCECCGTFISLYYSSYIKLGEFIHAICREKCFSELRQLGEIQFGGKIIDGVLPKELEEL